MAEKPTTTTTKTTRAAKDEAAVQEVIAALPEADRAIAERLHAVITGAAPELAPKLWYKQPAYARDGKVVCFFRGAAVDGERYLTLGFSGDAALDDGDLWATAFAVTGVGPAAEKKITALVKQAVR